MCVCGSLRLRWALNRAACLCQSETPAVQLGVEWGLTAVGLWVQTQVHSGAPCTVWAGYSSSQSAPASCLCLLLLICGDKPVQGFVILTPCVTALKSQPCSLLSVSTVRCPMSLRVLLSAMRRSRPSSGNFLFINSGWALDGGIQTQTNNFDSHVKS